ncbi:MAG TPA: S8 family serine peptidase [Thermoanaerobaculia bacterium]|nr:S8 family serine peptidase [Thermoanaerobaculia bacterium]
MHLSMTRRRPVLAPPRRFAFAAALLAALVGAPAAHAATVDPVLAQALAAAQPADTLRVVATFGAPLDAAGAAAVLGLVPKGEVLQRLPMALLVATPDQLAAVQALPGLRSLYLDRRLDYFLAESVPLIGAPRVWSELGFDGSGVRVAVIDTGIDATHPDLPYGAKVVQNIKIVGEDDTAPGVHVILEDQENTDLTSGHGTHVAATVAGTGSASGGTHTGVAPGAQLVGVGTGDVLFIFTALSGFDWVMEHEEELGIGVITNSWGTGGPFDPEDPINVASKAAVDAGMVVLFAAGNSGPGSDTLNPYSVAPWVIGVAAGNKDGQTLADFSSRGVYGDGLYQPTITAPGVDIVSAAATTHAVDGSYYTTLSGTSMATPHVAGVVALMLQANPGLPPAAVKRVLADTARPMPPYSVYTAGAGYVDAYAATQRAAGIKRVKKHKTRSGEEIDVYVVEQSFSGLIEPAVGSYNSVSTRSHTFEVGAGAVFLDVKLTWLALLNDIDLFLFQGDSTTATLASQDIQALSQEAREGAVVDLPAAGPWRAVVRGWLNTPEQYLMTVETYFPVAR